LTYAEDTERPKEVKRKVSPFYGKWVAVRLSEENKKCFIILRALPMDSTYFPMWQRFFTKPQIFTRPNMSMGLSGAILI